MHDELREFVAGMQGEAFFADTLEEAIRVLDGQAVRKVVLNLRTLADAGILRYVNVYYREQAEVIVSASREFDQIISVFRQGNYSRLHQPLRLEELKTVI